MAPRPLDPKHLVWNDYKKFELNSPQKAVCTDLNSQDVNRQHQEGDVRDLNTHVTDSQPVINGNYEPDNKNILESKPQNVENIVGNAITGVYFGFVPETSLKLYQGPPVYWKDIPSILQAHALVKNSGTHSYLKCRIPVNSHLNIDRWAYYLRNYWDQQIVDLLHYGFPLDFVRSSPLTPTYNNHTSALADI